MFAIALFILPLVVISIRIFVNIYSGRRSKCEPKEVDGKSGDDKLRRN